MPGQRPHLWMRHEVDTLGAARRCEVHHPRALHRARVVEAAALEILPRPASVGKLPEDRVEQTAARRNGSEAHPGDVRLLDLGQLGGRVRDEHVQRPGVRPRPEIAVIPASSTARACSSLGSEMRSA